MASNGNIDCTLTAEIDVSQEVATTEEVVDVDIITNVDDSVDTIPRLEVELAVTQWSLVSDAIFIKNITGEEPQWFIDLIDQAIRENEDLLLTFEEIQAAISSLNDGYTNLVSITDNHASQIAALKVSTDAATAAIVVLHDVKITEKQASAIANESITAWMRGGESAAWFNSHVQAVASDTSANTLAIIQLGAELDGVEAGVTEMSEALVEKYENPEWVGPNDPDPEGERQWIYEARAKHSLEVNANGSVSGFVADATSGPEGANSSFKIFADEFMICDKLDPDTNEPGTVAFLVRFDPITDEPTILLNGDVYFGNMPEYTGVNYTLYDVAMDSVIDPIEKTSLEKAYGELVDRDMTFDALIYQSAGRYHGLTGTHAIDTANYTASFATVTQLMDSLNIKGFSTNPEDPYLPTPLDSISLNRDTFNDIFFVYAAAYTKLNELMSDLVKQVADDSYNIMVNIVEDNIITATEKVQLNVYLAQVEAMYNSVAPGISHPDCATYPGKGFPEFSRYGVIYNAFFEYESSIYAVDGTLNPPTCPCVPSPCPDEYYLLNGIVTQMGLPAYDLANETVDTPITETDAAAALASTRWFVDSRAGYTTAVAGSTIDTTYIKVTSELDDAIYTLITDDIISTGEIGEHSYYGSGATRYISENYINFKTGAIHIYDETNSPVYFQIDSEASGAFVGICNKDNQSNFRGQLVEGAIGSFGQLHYGDTVAYADGGKYRTRLKSILNTKLLVHIYDMSGETEFSDSVRFYAPTFATNTDAVNDYRIHKIENAVFTGILSGAFMDRKSSTDYNKMLLVLEYRVDDGTWVDAGNQIPDTTNNQTVIFEAPVCSQYIDFRVRISYNSEHMSYAQRNVSLTMMLMN